MSEQTEQRWAAVSARRAGGAAGRGWRVLAVLAVLTAVEYVLAIVLDANLPILAAIALVKAGLIVHYFMHVTRVWRGAQEEE